MKCGNCGWNYPSVLLSRMFIASEGYTNPICGICALEVTNKIHGVTLNKFTGEMAEEIHQLAIKHRKHNPEDAPNANPEENKATKVEPNS